MYAISNHPLSKLSLAGFKAREGAPILKAGKHIVKSMKATYNDTGAKPRLEVRFANDDGEITARFNLWSESEKAREYSGAMLKTFLTMSGHGNPDNPFPAGLESLKAMEGHTIGVRVEEETYMKDGQTKTTSEVKGFFRVEAKADDGGEVPF